jgi:glycosyltransferase involved in cell wall biosynthesis
MDERELPYRLTVVGEGGEYANLSKAWSDHIVSGKVQMTGRLPREAIFEVLSDNDVFLLVSAFEGLPIALIEAMGCGCVPVVSDTPSGIPDLVLHGVNGFRVPVGDMARFAEHVEALQRDPELVGQMSVRARDHVLQNGFRDVDMGRSYSRMLHEIWDEITAGAFKRPEPILWCSPVPNVSPPGFALRINN